ncbi:MAG: hypothetical protein NPIRA05_04620 [Nitrospirales bacterium]|nr:MAG: hypothetical protein NPIRA05_04620 [Nitrospirales bacterium]
MASPSLMLVWAGTKQKASFMNYKKAWSGRPKKTRYPYKQTRDTKPEDQRPITRADFSLEAYRANLTSRRFVLASSSLSTTLSDLS